MRIFILILPLIFFFIQNLQANTCKLFLSSAAPTQNFAGYEDLNQKVLNLIDFSVENKFWNEKKADHAKEDLAGAIKLLQEKKGHPSFDLVFKEWTSFINSHENSLSAYKDFDEKNKLKWKQSVEVFLSFAIGQFITFVESSKSEVYAKNLSILKNLNSLKSGTKLESLLFNLELQVRRYFSIAEFKDCKF